MATNKIDSSNRPGGRKIIASNRKARHDYTILDTIEAGIAPLSSLSHAQDGTLKISHQFPSGTIAEGDFRDRLCRRFAADIEKRSNGALKAAVYPGSSLMKTNSQFSAMRKGALDLSLVPLSIYFKDGRVKVELGLGRGKKSYDKRQDMAKRDADRELARYAGRRAKGMG